jgi:copper chaperone CopZ
MDNITLTVPAMYADHHVIAVKRLLAPLAGVENVIASAAFKTVTVEFDAKRISRDALAKALSDAGYAPGKEDTIEKSPYAVADPAWDALGVRAVTTNPVDLQLSGEFRKY